MKTKQEALDLVLTGLWHAFIVGLAVVVISLLSGCVSATQRQETVSNMPTKVICNNLSYNLNYLNPRTVTAMAAELKSRNATCDEDAGSTITIK